MKKEVIKPFDLAKAKAGAKLKTRAGLPVEIFKWDARGDYPIKGMVREKEQDVSLNWTCDGFCCAYRTSSDYDLVIVEEVEEPEFWSDDNTNTINGFYIYTGTDISKLSKVPNIPYHHDVFATKKQAKSALAMARISQIMVHDIEHFGGVVTDEEWKEDKPKFVIYRMNGNAFSTSITSSYSFLAFHTAEQRNRFLEKYPQLVADYLMI